MAVLVIMPKQGQSVESCIITELNKKKGDPVKKGEVLFSYETDKASFEEESPVDGTVLAVFAGEGDEVPVLDRMMIVGEPGEDISELLGKEAAGADATATLPESDATVAGAPGKTGTGKGASPTKGEGASSPVDGGSPTGGPASAEASLFSSAPGESRPGESVSPFISPRARKLAAEHAVDGPRLEGSGPGGRVIERDVRRAIEERPRMTPLAKKIASEQGTGPAFTGSGLGGRARSSDLASPVAPATGASAPSPGTRAVAGAVQGDFEDRKLSNIRKLIARSMHASLQNSAQLTHHLGADARRILELRKDFKAALEAGRIETNITLNDLVCLAAVRALKKFPSVNSHFLGDAIRVFKKVHLGIAVDTERGLMVPAIRDADDLSVEGLSSRLREAAAACRAGSVSPDVLSPGAASFTVSNLGAYGVEMFTPVINLPQSAILGVNTIVPRPKDLGGGVYAFVPYMGLSLTYDHRALDGGEATRFLKQVAVEIETLEI